MQNHGAGGFCHPLHVIRGLLNPANTNGVNLEG